MSDKTPNAGSQPQKIYRRLVIDIASGEILDEDSYLYSGPLALCEGDEGEDSSGAAPADGGGAPVESGAGASDAPAETEPKTMLDAVNQHIDAGAAIKNENPAATEKPATDKPEAKPAAQAKPKEEKPKDDKAKDDIYKMPVGLKAESQQRFQKLVDTTKESVARAEKAEAAAQTHEATVSSFRQILEETQTSAEDLSQLLEYNRLVKSGDLEGALKILDEQRSIIAQYLGKPIEGVDVLQGFDDLKQSVEAQQITIEHAAELAKARRLQSAIQQQQQDQQQQQQSQEEMQKAVQAAVSSITAFATEKSKTDIDYKKKEEILLKAANTITSKFPPNFWREQIELMYDNIVVPTTVSAPMQRPPQPLRPNSAGGGKPQPKNMGEAIDVGLGYGPTA